MSCPLVGYTDVVVVGHHVLVCTRTRTHPVTWTERNIIHSEPTLHLAIQFKVLQYFIICTADPVTKYCPCFTASQKYFGASAFFFLPMTHQNKDNMHVTASHTQTECSKKRRLHRWTKKNYCNTYLDWFGRQHSKMSAWSIMRLDPAVCPLLNHWNDRIVGLWQ